MNNKFILSFLSVVIAFFVLVPLGYSQELANLAAGEAQTITMPILIDGEQFIYTFRYKYNGAPKPVFVGPIIFKYNKNTREFDKLDAGKIDNNMPWVVVNDVEELIGQVCQAGRDRFAKENERASEERNGAEESNLSNGPDSIQLLGAGSGSANTPGQIGDGPGMRLLGSDDETPGQITENGILNGNYTSADPVSFPDGQPIFKRRSTSIAIANGTISEEDLTDDDYVALEHYVTENEDGSTTVTLVLPKGSSTRNITPLTQRLALSPQMYLSNDSQIASGTIRMHLGGTNRVAVNPENGNVVVTKTYFVRE